MDNPYLWTAVLASALASYFSLNSYALRTVSRHELEEQLAGRKDLTRALLEGEVELSLACGLLRALFNMALLVSLLAMLDASAYHWRGTLAALGITAAIVSVFGVAIPHSWAHYSAARILAVNARLLLALRKPLWPVIALMRAFDEPVRRLSGGAAEPDEAGAEQEEAAKQEILHVAGEAHAEGTVEREEMEMIESVMKFGDQRAGEIMTPRTDIHALPVTAGLADIRHFIATRGHTRIPLYDGDIDNIVGILHTKDLLAVENLAGADLRKLVRKPFFVPETKQLDELMREFKARKQHMAIVLDEYGGTAGLVTLEDLVEQIVGEIADEHDLPGSILIKPIDEGVWEADGRTYIDDINSAAGVALPEDEDYDTLAGFVFSELGFVPPPGETLTAHGAKFTVLAADDRKITRIRIERLEPEENA